MQQYLVVAILSDPKPGRAAADTMIVSQEIADQLSAALERGDDVLFAKSAQGETYYIDRTKCLRVSITPYDG